jgi:hypothetical protein
VLLRRGNQASGAASPVLGNATCAGGAIDKSLLARHACHS